MSDLTDDTKLNCAGEFMMACDDSYRMSQVVGALSSLLDGRTNIEFIEEFSEALSYSIGQAREFYPDITDKEERDDAQTDCLEEILRFSHAYLAKAYQKKVGRA
jgi:hypothetical protein